MMNIPENVVKNVTKYLEGIGYELEVIIKFSQHPDDSHLFMVVGSKKNKKSIYGHTDNYFAAWSSWNEETQSLNHGHYDLTYSRAVEVLRDIKTAV